MKDSKGQKRVIIENVKPRVNGGTFPVKRVVHDRFSVTADIFCDSHDVLSAVLKYKSPGEDYWQRVEMEYLVNDKWTASFDLPAMGSYFYTVEAHVDHFKSWHRDILKKMEARTDYSIDLHTGARFIRETLDFHENIAEKDLFYLQKVMVEFLSDEINPENKIEPILSHKLFLTMVKYPVVNHVTSCGKTFEVFVDRGKANFSSWYEVFPRSLKPEGNGHGTFKDTIGLLPYVADMDFDVLYLPPIHPIGETKRKGRNNTTVAESGDPGSPWAIGSHLGGHKAIHPELGSMEDFRELISQAAKRGIEIAMDIAFQCSPDHPWVKEHPQWFRHRPDGTLQYAENPPKKYEDIVPLNFETDDWKGLWNELKSVFLFWIEEGVKIFRVDNPHTKSFYFWEWVIREIKSKHPDVIFLAEAFTRPKVMHNLAKRGFTQSYTYFTWRNTKHDLVTYCNELVNSDSVEFFRPNFWPNTPDILPEFLQISGRTGFIQRLILAATLSSNYGIYGPAFELMENEPIETGREEYLNSEKYEIKQWNFDDSRSLKKIIARVNRIRRENRALQNTHSLRFHDIDNEALICYSKTSDDFSSIILVVVSLDPHHTHSGWLRFSPGDFKMDHHTSYQVHDLISGSYFLWSGEHHYVEINPGIMPAHIFRVRRKVRSERDFDYFM